MEEKNSWSKKRNVDKTKFQRKPRTPDPSSESTSWKETEGSTRCLSKYFQHGFYIQESPVKGMNQDWQ